MDQIIKYVLGEMRVIADAPVVFLAALLIAAGVIWWALDWRYGGIIANRDSDIATLKNRIEEYKNKAGGASPDEVKRKLDDLAEMTNFTIGANWRNLTSKETVDLQKYFSAITPKRIQIMYSNYRGKALARSFENILRAAGWTDIHFSEGGGLGYGISTGPGDSTAKVLKAAIERATDFKVSLFGPEEPNEANGCFIAVGINAPEPHK
jgi:hypothetical protein